MLHCFIPVQVVRLMLPGLSLISAHNSHILIDKNKAAKKLAQTSVHRVIVKKVVDKFLGFKLIGKTQCRCSSTVEQLICNQ